MIRRLLRALLPAVLCLLPALPAAALTIEPVRSDGGITAWLIEDHSNPLIAVDAAFTGGAALDPADKQGLAGMVAALLDEGAGPLDAQAFQGRLEDLGIGFTAAAGDDSLQIQMQTLAANRAAAFHLLALALTRPRFDAAAQARIRGQIESLLARQEQDPRSVAGRAFSRQLYPHHPYGRDPAGSMAGLRAITTADLAAYPARRLTRDRLRIGVAGDITPARLKPLLDAAFAALPAQGEAAPLPEAAAQARGRVTVIRRSGPQSVVLFGQQGLKRDDPDWYAALVMNDILGGGGFSSRLMTELRVRRGLVYGIETSLAPLDHGALIDGGTATGNDRVAETIALIRQAWRRMAADGATDAELAAAKTYLIGSFPLRLDSTPAIARMLVALQRDHLGPGYLKRRAALICAVTAADIRRVAKRLLDAKTLEFVVVGDPKGV